MVYFTTFGQLICKLTSFIEYCTFSMQLQQKTLELKIAELKAQQNEEKLAQEQAQVKLYAEKISQLLETEKNLRLQLAADGEKFQQFQVNTTLALNTIHICQMLCLTSVSRIRV